MSSSFVSSQVVDRRNNFDFLRITAAASVIVGHAYHLVGTGYPPGLLGVPIQTLGVYVFFSISGFLVGQSLDRSNSVFTYLRNRSLRLFPALVVVVVACAFVIGPAVTTMATFDYLTSAGTWTYLTNIALYPTYALPGVFETLPYPYAVNGSLWTLPVEFASYLVLPVVFLLRGWWRLAGAITAGLLIGGAGISLSAAPPVVAYGTNLRDAASIAVFFFMSAGLSVVAARRPQLLRIDVALLAVPGIFIVSAFEQSLVIYLLWFVLPYCCISFGSHATPVVRRFGRWGDPSYGVYLWGFPIQQMVVTFIGPLPIWLDVAVVLVLSCVVGYASWWAIEKRALKLKATGTSMAMPRGRTVPVAQRNDLAKVEIGESE